MLYILGKNKKKSTQSDAFTYDAKNSDILERLLNRTLLYFSNTVFPSLEFL